MTRILHFLETADPRYGGPIEAARTFGTVWNNAGYQHDLVTLDPSNDPIPTNFPGGVFNIGAPYGRSPLRRYRYSAKAVKWLRQHALNYDAVIVSGLWRYQARAALKALAGGPTPYFVFTHGMLDPWFRRTYPIKHLLKQLSWWWAEGRLLRRATNVLFTTEEERVLAENAFWPYKLQPAVVNYGTADVIGERNAQIAVFRAAVPAVKERRFLLFLSRIHRKKGCDLLIDAFAAIAPSHPDLDLVIAGPDQSGLVAKLKQQAERLGIGRRVHFPGMLGGDVKYGAYRSADAFVLTSHQENFGIVVAEAMSCETPVLISDKVNIWREVVADGAGLVAPDTIEGSTDLLTRFTQASEADRREMAARARASFLARFNVETAAATLMGLIQRRIALRPERSVSNRPAPPGRTEAREAVGIPSAKTGEGGGEPGIVSGVPS